MKRKNNKNVVIGVETEAYSIDTEDFDIGRKISKPMPGTMEKDEDHDNDSSIGSEYKSKPFESIREAFFLLKAGFRKYLRNIYKSKEKNNVHPVPLLTGTWTNRFAGTHLHISLSNQRLPLKDALQISKHLRPHIPLLIAMGANSPVWHRKITAKASNRILHGSKKYFVPLKKNFLRTNEDDEITFNAKTMRKPDTLELRILDSNIPEFTVICMCIVKAIVLRWYKKGSITNKIKNDEHYYIPRNDAASRGMKSKLRWNGELLKAPRYLDKFIWEYRDEFEFMDIPEDIYEVLRLIKLGYNGSRILHEACIAERHEHPRAWENYFAEKYYKAIQKLLSGNSLKDFAWELGIELPNTERVWLGARHSSM